ncbi:MAG TPA: c-type cytochrome [Aggregatilineaceae bacterium]|nr:c-type cytochrome [Aggregatilineaceae bacterium]
MKRLLLTLGFCLALAGCGGLSAEPQIISTSALPTVTPTLPPDSGAPTRPLSLAQGAAIFSGTQGCWQCHGEKGAGDGPVVKQGSITCPLTDFTDPASQRSKAIKTLFTIVTNGNMTVPTCAMPFWNTRYNEQQRWAVTSYVYSLHYTPDMLAQGQKVWSANCAACHGEKGAGDGPRVGEFKRKLSNYTDPAVLVTQSDTALWDTVTQGVGQTMPGFASQLDENSRWAVVAYMRTLGWDNTPVATATPTIVPTDAPTLTVTGKLTDGTQNKPFASQPVTLRIIDNSGTTPNVLKSLDTTTGTDGSFRFMDVPRQNGMVYIATTAYAGQLQLSTPLKLAAGSGNTLDLSFTAYDVTADPGIIIIDRREIVVDFITPTSVQVREAIEFTNTGNRMFLTGAKTADGRTVSVQVSLPAGAESAAVDTNSASSYVIEGGALRGTLPILPGSPALVQFSYNLSFADHLVIMAPAGYRTDSLGVFVPRSSGVKVRSANDSTVFAPGQPSPDNTYDTYEAQRPVKPDATLAVQIVGVAEQSTDRRNVLLIVLGVALGTGLVMAGAIWRLTRTVPNDRETLIRLIAALDDLYAAGDLARKDYEARRAKLKEKLAKL